MSLINRLFRSPTPGQLNIGLLLVRLVVGTVFIAHGAQKLFVYGFAGVAGAFGQMGIPFADVVGPLVGLVEFFGGIALVLGLLTRVAALGIAAVMLGAIAFVHIGNGLFLPNGYEFALSLLGSAGLLLLAGPGAVSLDARLGKRTEMLSFGRAEKRKRHAA